MLADLLKGIVLGVAVWVLLFLFSFALLFFAVGSIGYDLILLITPIPVLLVAGYYLKDPNIVEKTMEGLRLGIVWLVLTALLDVVFQAFVRGVGMGYFISLRLWITYVEIVVCPMAVGYFLMRRKKRWV